MEVQLSCCKLQSWRGRMEVLLYEEGFLQRLTLTVMVKFHGLQVLGLSRILEEILMTLFRSVFNSAVSYYVMAKN
jgi:hypothetical protein